MPEAPDPRPEQPASVLGREIGSREARKLKARRHAERNIWFGLGMFGLIGWSVVVPALIGVALGIWLDRHYARPQSWTLTLLFVGLALGCWNAWHWISRERRQIQDEEQESR